MDISEIIEEGGKESGQKEQAPVIKPRKRINKKIFIIPVSALLILGVSAYLFLYKGSAPNIITGHGGAAVFPPTVSNQFISNIAKVKPENKNKAVNLVIKSPVKSNNTAVKEAKSKAGKAVAESKKPGNTLNDLFTVKYKHNKRTMRAGPNMPPNANVPNVPAIPFNQNLPNFNLKSMASKIKNMQGLSSGSSFNVSGYSGGYVIAECGKSTKYLKAGQSACGYTLLKANSNDATFSHNGQFKKISY